MPWNQIDYKHKNIW